MNRRERRRMEKQFGLMKEYQNGSREKKSEIRTRRKEMGKMFHQQHLQRIENDNRTKVDDQDAKFMQELIESGNSESDAKDILNQKHAKREEALERQATRRKNIEHKTKD